VPEIQPSNASSAPLDEPNAGANIDPISDGVVGGTTSPVTGRGIGGTSGRGLGRLWGRISALTLLLIAVACFGSLPYTASMVTPADASELPQRRYESANLRMNLLPPRWWPLSEVEAERIELGVDRGAAEPTRWLGTDRLGRDLLARCLVGGAVSLTVGIFASAIAVAVGTVYGMIAGFVGGRVDAAMMRVVDVIYGLPTILLVVLLAVAADGTAERFGIESGSPARQAIGLVTLLVAIGGVSWLTLARVIRGQVLSLRAQPFMEACRAIGVPIRLQLWRHLLPNLIGPITVYATLTVPAAMLSESFLSFLGIGVREPLPSWGNLAAAGLAELNPVSSRWWLLLWPCALIALTLLALNFVGEWLRERLDPRARHSVAVG